MGIGSATLIYVGVTALLFRNLLSGLDTHVYSDLGDPLLNVAILSWNATVPPLTESWWNFPSFAPLTGVTAFTEHLLLAYPIASPIVWATGNPILAYNIVFLLSPVLNALAAYALARELTRSTIAAFIAGLAFAYAPYQSVRLSHVQTMMAFGMPLALLGLHRYAGRDTRRQRMWGLVLFGGGWFITALSNAYMLAFFPVVVALWCAWFVRNDWRRLVTIAATAGVAVLPIIPVLWGYRLRHVAYELSRQHDEIVSFSADVVGLAGISHRGWLWSGWLPTDYGESSIFPGFTIVVLAVSALIASGQNRLRESAWVGQVRPAPQSQARASRSSHRLLITAGVLTCIVLARVYTGYWGWHVGPIPLPPFQPAVLFTVAFALVVAGVALSAPVRRAWQHREPVAFYALVVVVLFLFVLGPEPAWSKPWRVLSFGPYGLLMSLPGFDSIRVPARFWLPAVLCLSVLAGFGAAAIARRYSGRRRILVAVLAAALLCEGWFSDATIRAPQPMRAGAIPPGAVVLDLPMEESHANAVPQYRAVLGGYRTINGYSGYEPQHFLPLRRALANLQADALDDYRRRSDLYLIIRPGQDVHVARWLTTQPYTQYLFDAEDARIYRMARLPW